MAIAGENLLVCGKLGHLLYGKRNTLLYKDGIAMSAHINISWTDGDDVDICAFWSKTPDIIAGFSYTGGERDGFTTTWTSSDNTTGGPEEVDIAYSGGAALGKVTFDVHTNWYRVKTVGSDEEEPLGGNCTVTITGKILKNGEMVNYPNNTKTLTFHPANNRRSPARSGDPGIRITFNNNGTIKGIVAL